MRSFQTGTGLLPFPFLRTRRRGIYVQLPVKAPSMNGGVMAKAGTQGIYAADPRDLDNFA